MSPVRPWCPPWCRPSRFVGGMMTSVQPALNWTGEWWSPAVSEPEPPPPKPHVTCDDASFAPPKPWRAATYEERNEWAGRVDSAEMMEALREGDEDAYEALFREYYQQLCQFAYRYVRSPEAAEEVVQEVLGALRLRRGEIAVRVSIKSYLYGAVRYRALNLVARNKVEATWLAQALQNGAPALSTERAADDQIVLDEQVAALGEAVSNLPPKRRSVFVLRSTTQMSYAEIAEVLQTSVKNVEVQLRRATHSLRAALPQHAE
jgi:RNA polymerase sigma-70 factor, ECF subfamily